MMLNVALKFAASTVAAILTTATIHNTFETFSICSPSNNSNVFKDPSSILNHYLQEHDNNKNDGTSTCSDIDNGNLISNKYFVKVPEGKSKLEILQDLQTMNRRELVTLFKHCDVPDDLGAIEGDWDGILLNNNLVLTSVSKFLTNQLFGKNEPWNGKTFGASNVGINRFVQTKKEDSNEKNSSTSIRKTHNFAYTIQPSIFGGSSIQLKYSPYQGNLSLWKTMVDELRIIKVPKGKIERSNQQNNGDNTDYILLGMGSMAWSGGMYNCQPFCLHKSTISQSTTSLSKADSSKVSLASK